MQSHLSSQGSVGFGTMPQSMPQYSYQPPQQHQQQDIQQSMQSWPGYEEVRTSPRHPGAWHWSDGMGHNLGQNLGQSQMDGLNPSGSNNWDSQQAQSSQFSMPSQADWHGQQPWRQQQSDASGLTHASLHLPCCLLPFAASVCLAAAYSVLPAICLYLSYICSLAAVEGACRMLHVHLALTASLKFCLVHIWDNLLHSCYWQPFQLVCTLHL